MKIRIGTRGSQLARAQSATIGRAFAERGHEIELIVIETEGDVQNERPFVEIGAHGVFVRRIEQALLEDRIDVAVHSYKDLPSTGPEELLVAAVPPREDPRDLFLVRSDAASAGETIPIRERGRVGTASARRRVLLADVRPDLEVVLLRGNVPTRLRRLRDGDFDAIVLAAAGVARLIAASEREGKDALSFEGIERTPLDPEIFVPAPTQGAIAVQVRADDPAVRAIAEELDDPNTRRCTRAERRLLARVEGGCEVAFGAWCRGEDGNGLKLDAVLETERGLARAGGSGDAPEELAEAVWRRLEPEARVR